jgi:hypothetical protein
MEGQRGSAGEGRPWQTLYSVSNVFASLVIDDGTQVELRDSRRDARQASLGPKGVY